jgi:hypothetical protein
MKNLGKQGLYGIEEIQGTDAKLTGIASVLFYNMEWN